MITKAQSLDNFIDKSLYEKNKGYYQRKMNLVEEEILLHLQEFQNFFLK